MGEFFYEGDLEESGVNEVSTTDFVALPVGKCKYGFLLNEKGGVIDDLIVYKLKPNRLMFVVNAARIDADFNQIKSHIKSGLFEDKSNVTSKIDIQGPKSQALLQTLATFDLDELKYFSFKETTLLDAPAIISRTGYTGELGYELYIDNETAPKLWDKLIALGATPAGLGARDVLRVEMGYSLYGHELDETITPLEASLGFFVKFNRPYIGKEALERQKKEGIPRKIIAFSTRTKRAPRNGFEIFQNGQKIGVVTSGTFSPSLGEGIGLGLVTCALYKQGNPMEIKNERGAVAIYEATLPFYKKS
jgi:aminomethyltransferase